MGYAKEYFRWYFPHFENIMSYIDNGNPALVSLEFILFQSENPIYKDCVTTVQNPMHETELNHEGDEKTALY